MADVSNYSVSMRTSKVAFVTMVCLLLAEVNFHMFFQLPLTYGTVFTVDASERLAA